MTARDLLAAATPRPWTANDTGGYGAIASADATAIARFIERYPKHGASDVAAYGGALVGESIQASDRALIVAAVNTFEALLDLAEVAGAHDCEYAPVIPPEGEHSCPLCEALDRLDALRSGT